MLEGPTASAWEPESVVEVTCWNLPLGVSEVKKAHEATFVVPSHDAWK